jgi:hypothetical protein
MAEPILKLSTNRKTLDRISKPAMNKKPGTKKRQKMSASKGSITTIVWEYGP